MLRLMPEYYCMQTMIYSLFCQLYTNATLNKNVQLLQPRFRTDIKANTKCQVTGWGVTNSKSRFFSDTLREVTVTVINRKLCNSQSYYNHNPIITKDLACAGNTRGQKDSCKVRAYQTGFPEYSVAALF